MGNARAFELLLDAIASAQSSTELDRFARLAMLHYAGGMREELERLIETKRQVLAPTRKDSS